MRHARTNRGVVHCWLLCALAHLFVAAVDSTNGESTKRELDALGGAEVVPGKRTRRATVIPGANGELPGSAVALRAPPRRTRRISHPAPAFDLAPAAQAYVSVDAARPGIVARHAGGAPSDSATDQAVKWYCRHQHEIDPKTGKAYTPDDAIQKFGAPCKARNIRKRCQSIKEAGAKVATSWDEAEQKTAGKSATVVAIREQKNPYRLTSKNKVAVSKVGKVQTDLVNAALAEATKEYAVAKNQASKSVRPNWQPKSMLSIPSKGSLKIFSFTSAAFVTTRIDPGSRRNIWDLFVP